MDMGRAQARRRHNEERCNDLVERSSAAGVQLAQARERLEALEAERNSNQLVLDSAADELAAAQRQMELYQREAADAVNALSGLEHEQETMRATIMETVGAASNLRNQLAQAAERLAALDRESQRLHAEMETANWQIQTFGGQRGQQALEFETVSQRVAGLTQEISEVRLLLG